MSKGRKHNRRRECLRCHGVGRVFVHGKWKRCRSCTWNKK